MLETLLRALFAWLVYPGLLFLLVGGLLAEGLRRQFAARAEGRDAPPFLQPLADIRKWLGRATYLTDQQLPAEDDSTGQQLAATRQEAGRLSLYAIPLLGIVALTSGVVLLPLPGNLWPFLDSNNALGADLPGVALLFLLPCAGTILLGSLTGSVYAQVAGARIFQLAVACGVPYATAVFGPAVAKGSLNLTTVTGDNSLALIGVKALCGLLFLLCLPVVLRLRPLAAAQAEVLEGVTTDFSGPVLALLLLMQSAERLALPLLFAVLFIPLAASNPLFLALGLLLGLGVIGAVDTLFSQVRLRDALTFYLRYANPAAVVLLVLVAFGVKG